MIKSDWNTDRSTFCSNFKCLALADRFDRWEGEKVANSSVMSSQIEKCTHAHHQSKKTDIFWHRKSLCKVFRSALLVRSEIRDPPGNFQETLKFPGALEISRGPGFFQVLEIFRPPWNFQVFVSFIPMENSWGGAKENVFLKAQPHLLKTELDFAIRNLHKLLFLTTEWQC